jgi:hypothetical protein
MRSAQRVADTGEVSARLLLIASVLALVTTPAAALAAESPTSLGYSAADVPALGASQTPTGAAYSAADVPAIAAQPAAGACTGIGTTAANASPTASGYGGGVDPTVLGTQCSNTANPCPAGTTLDPPGTGTTLDPPGTGTAGSAAASGSGEFVWLMPDPAVIDSDSVAAGRSIATGQVTSSRILQESSTIWGSPSRSTGLPIGCLCPTSSAGVQSGSLPVVRLAPDSTLVAGGIGALLSAVACGLAVLLVDRRRRRPPRVAPW